MSNKELRIGQGFDTHAFDTDEAPLVRLCGIDIPHSHGLRGGYLADVGFHALTDALLGAMAAGDIGDLLDQGWGERDSTQLLGEVAILVASMGRILNADLTIFCESIRLAGYRTNLRESVARTLHVPVQSISVKAKTSDGIGSIGRGEGISAHATVLIQVDRSNIKLNSTSFKIGEFHAT
jgi:2-C-methyl-D-erythritol 4-phosphate cytidylyltransferase/2-C-methyl-D-erythritol 2,4-cyclodiphosphate synthase